MDSSGILKLKQTIYFFYVKLITATVKKKKGSLPCPKQGFERVRTLDLRQT